MYDPLKRPIKWYKDKMKDQKTRSFFMKIDTNDDSILNAWNSLLHMLTNEHNGFSAKWAKALDERSLCHFSTHITVHGDKDILVNTCGLSAEILLPPNIGKDILIELLWETFKLNWKGWNDTQKLNERATTSILRCMNRDIYWEEISAKTVERIG